MPFVIPLAFACMHITLCCLVAGSRVMTPECMNVNEQHPMQHSVKRLSLRAGQLLRLIASHLQGHTSLRENRLYLVRCCQHHGWVELHNHSRLLRMRVIRCTATIYPFRMFGCLRWSTLSPGPKTSAIRVFLARLSYVLFLQRFKLSYHWHVKLSWLSTRDGFDRSGYHQHQCRYGPALLTWLLLLMMMQPTLRLPPLLSMLLVEVLCCCLVCCCSF